MWNGNGVKSLFDFIIVFCYSPRMSRPLRNGVKSLFDFILVFCYSRCMSRPLRIEYPNAFYHVMNRGNNRQAIFLNDGDYGIFLKTLKETSHLLEIKILSFCLMTNHYHLLLCTPRANLSRVMRQLNGVYTQRFNRRHKKDGHLFRGRYKAVLVQEDEYLTHLIRYIHLNPGQDSKNYPYSSHKQYIRGKDEAPWLCVRMGLAFFSNKLGKAQQAYQEFIDRGIDPHTQKFYLGKKQSSIFGDVNFVNDIKEKYLFNNQKITTEIPEQRSLSGQANAKRILETVAKDFKITKDLLFYSRRGELNESRLIAITLTRDLSGLTLPEIAPIFQMNSYKSVGSACHRLRSYFAKDLQLKNRFDRLRIRCSQKETWPLLLRSAREDAAWNKKQIQFHYFREKRFPKTLWVLWILMGLKLVFRYLLNLIPSDLLL